MRSSAKPPSKLEEALQKFNETLNSVTNTQRSLLTGGKLTIDEVLTFGKSVTEQWKPGKEEKRLKNVNNFLKSLQAYGPIIDVFIRPIPAMKSIDVKSIVWGGIKFILMVAESVEKDRRPNTR
jgi:hypothetical protein